MKKERPGRPVPLIKADFSNVIDVFCELMTPPSGQEDRVIQGTTILLQMTNMDTPLSDHDRSENQQAIARATERGLLVRKEIEKEEGGSRSSEQIAELLNISGQEVEEQRRERKLIAWQDTAGDWRFPVWQFNKRGCPFPELATILKELPGDPWSDMSFFLSESEWLQGRPLDLLRRNKGKSVRVAAMRFGRQGA